MVALPTKQPPTYLRNITNPPLPEEIKPKSVLLNHLPQHVGQKSTMLVVFGLGRLVDTVIRNSAPTNKLPVVRFFGAEQPATREGQ